MNKKKANELLGKFWEECPDSEVIDESIYTLDYFITWLWDEGFEICPREFVSNEVDKEE
jgi:hypothetical protein